MKLRRFLLRYYPPGIILDYLQGGVERSKSIDLLDLSVDSDIEDLLLEICAKEPLITEKRRPQIRMLIEKLKAKIAVKSKKKYSPFKVLRAHILPLTNVAFNKTGSHFITGSYDRTCKVWESASGKEIHTLDGHRNVVYAIAFNVPFSDKIATGSFDKTARLWSTETGECFHVFEGHSAELVCLQFNPISTLLATGSMDTTAKLWDIENGSEVANFSGHTAEVISLQFSQGANTSAGSSLAYGQGSDGLDANQNILSEGGRLLLTGSFDHTVCLWDVRTGKLAQHLIGHSAEISVATFSYDAQYVASASMDKSVRIWDTRTGRTLQILTGHADEVLDVCFDLTGKKVASASADGSARIWIYSPSNLSHTPYGEHFASNVFKSHAQLLGHEMEVSKVCFNSLGDRLLTASADKTARLWDVETGSLCDVLMGHSDEIFSCAFNYDGSSIITASKDNTCRIWR